MNEQRNIQEAEIHLDPQLGAWKVMRNLKDEQNQSYEQQNGQNSQEGKRIFISQVEKEWQ